MAVGGSAYPPRPNSLSTGKEAPEIRRGTHKRVRGHCPRKHRIAPLGRVGSAGPRPGPARPCLQSKPSSSPRRTSAGPTPALIPSRRGCCAIPTALLPHRVVVEGGELALVLGRRAARAVVMPSCM